MDKLSLKPQRPRVRGADARRDVRLLDLWRMACGVGYGDAVGVWTTERFDAG